LNDFSGRFALSRVVSYVGVGVGQAPS
jgi:hypothetical protein